MEGILNGVLYGVSVGPGDPELMTLKAVKLINSCGIIAVPRTSGENSLALEIAQQVCDLSEKKIIYLDFIMSKDRKLLEKRHQSIALELYKYLEIGESIAFLNIGDIAVYSTFSYIADLLEKQEIKIDTCSGVTSFCAAASAIGESLVQGKNPLIVIPASCSKFDELLKQNGTKVIMKNGRDIMEIKSRLKINGYKKVSAICNCGMESEKIYRGIDSIPDECGYFTIIMAVKEI